MGKIVLINPFCWAKLIERSAKYISSFQGIGEIDNVTKLKTKRNKSIKLVFIVRETRSN
jgi:hypothetical protein